MNAIQNKFISTLRGFIAVHDGDLTNCREMGDLILEASRVADRKGIEPPCLDFRKFYSDEIYRLQTIQFKNAPQQNQHLVVYL